MLINPITPPVDIDITIFRELETIKSAIYRASRKYQTNLERKEDEYQRQHRPYHTISSTDHATSTTNSPVSSAALAT